MAKTHIPCIAPAPSGGRNVTAILDGTQPFELTVKRLLTDIRIEWGQQRHEMGFLAKAWSKRRFLRTPPTTTSAKSLSVVAEADLGGEKAALNYRKRKRCAVAWRLRGGGWRNAPHQAAIAALRTAQYSRMPLNLRTHWRALAETRIFHGPAGGGRSLARSRLPLKFPVSGKFTGKIPPSVPMQPTPMAGFPTNYCGSAGTETIDPNC